MKASINIKTVKVVSTGKKIAQAKEGAKTDAVDTNETIEVVEYGQHSLVIECAKVQATPNLSVLIDGKIKIGAVGTPFVFTGKITSSAEVSENKQSIGIELHQFDKALWKKFIDNAATDQTRTDRILDSIKGED